MIASFVHTCTMVVLVRGMKCRGEEAGIKALADRYYPEMKHSMYGSTIETTCCSTITN